MNGMTARYDLLINSIAATNEFIVTLAAFALGAVLAYNVLGWLPHWAIRPARYAYLALMLGMYVFTLVVT